MKKILTIILLTLSFNAISQVVWEAHDGIETTSTRLDTSRAVTGNEIKGQSFWDEDNLTYSTVLGNGVIYQEGQELFRLVKNNTGNTIPDGTPVAFIGAVGASGNIKVAPTWDAAPIRPVQFVGWVTQDIANGDAGLVTIGGKVRGFQTNGANYGEAWMAEDVIIINCETGYPSNDVPAAPAEYILAGVVTVSHATMGTIEVDKQISMRIMDASDVNGTPLTEGGQFLVWDQGNGYFDPTKNINDYLRNDSVIINIDFKDLSVFYYTVPFDMTLSTQESQNKDAVIDPILGTSLSKFDIVTVTPDTTGLIILSGSR
jgi:hypothetical protein